MASNCHEGQAYFSSDFSVWILPSLAEFIARYGALNMEQQWGVGGEDERAIGSIIPCVFLTPLQFTILLQTAYFSIVIHNIINTQSIQRRNINPPELVLNSE